MTSPDEGVAQRVTVIGTGLMGTSVALAATRTGTPVRGWDADPDVSARAAAGSGLEVAPSLEAAVQGADLVLVCTPIPTIAPLVAAALAAAPDAIVTDVGSVSGPVARDVAGRVGGGAAGRGGGGAPPPRSGKRGAPLRANPAKATE